MYGLKRAVSVCLCAALLISCVSILSSCSAKSAVAIIACIDDAEQSELYSGIYDAATRYEETSGKTFMYYTVEADYSDSAEVLAKAAKDRAETILVVDHVAGDDIIAAAEENHDIKYIVVDSELSSLPENVMIMDFDEEQAGYLAGYAAVCDGFTSLGFIGGVETATIKSFYAGYGKGAKDAAAALKTTYTMKSAYSGDYKDTPETESLAEEWYFNGTEVIFACGGALGYSVMRAAEKGENRYVIGVDSDQSHESAKVISSVIKSISNTLYNMMVDFKGGETYFSDLSNGGIGLEMKNARWRSFDSAAYEALVTRLTQE